MAAIRRRRAVALFAWQVKYTVLFWACALLLAAFFTYLIEKPTAKQLLRKKKIIRT